MKRPRRLPADRARRFCAALGDLSDHKPQRWRMVHSVAQRLGVDWEEATLAAREAEAEGWLTLQGGHSVCLTEEGRRLEARKE